MYFVVVRQRSLRFIIYDVWLLLLRDAMRIQDGTGNQLYTVRDDKGRGLL